MTYTSKARAPLYGLAALACETGAFALAPLAGLAAAVGLHAAASALCARALCELMPPEPPEPQRGAWVFFFAECLFLPGFGMLLMLGVVGLTRTMARRGGSTRLALHPGPTYDAPEASPAATGTRSALRAHLANPALPMEARLRALLTVQSIPARTANPMIRGMLADPSEDLRLIAYGILDAREKAIHARINAAQRRLAATPQAARAAMHKELAELHRELVYQRLVQGDLREHAAAQARAHVQQALALAPLDPALHALHGRIALAAGDCTCAARALERALELGLAPSRVLPYLAEVAFRSRRFEDVRGIVRRVASRSSTLRIDQVLAYWKTA